MVHVEQKEANEYSMSEHDVTYYNIEHNLVQNRRNDPANMTIYDTEQVKLSAVSLENK